MNGGVRQVVTRGTASGGRKAKLHRVRLVSIEQKGIVVDLRAGRIPRDDRAVGTSSAFRAQEAGGEINEVITDRAAGVIEVRRGVVQPVGDCAVHVQKGILFGDGVGGMPPKQDGGIP